MNCLIKNVTVVDSKSNHHLKVTKGKNLYHSNRNEEEKVNCTLFSLDDEFIFTSQLNKSQAVNSPFFDIKLKGKPVAVFNNNQYKIC